jgi:AraC-like DNA-binding protein
MSKVQLKKPAPMLQRYVQFYLERELRERRSLVVHSVPARAASMFEFFFGEPIRIRYPGSSVEQKSPQSVVVGMLKRPHGELRLQGPFRSFIIMFQPTGLSALFRLDAGELTNRDLDLRSVFGNELSELEDRLAECDSFASRAAVANVFLARRIQARRETGYLSFATDSILASHGRVRIANLTAYAGISKRHFERTFRTQFGMQPKLYARIVRFQAALDRKARSFTRTWTDVAQDFGYHDQMHMIHDFQEFTGTTPTETLHLLETFFRQQLDAIRRSRGRAESERLPRLVI